MSLRSDITVGVSSVCLLDCVCVCGANIIGSLDTGLCCSIFFVQKKKKKIRETFVKYCVCDSL